MALLNPPELRASMMAVLALYLAQSPGHNDEFQRTIDAVSPPSLSDAPDKHQLDAVKNLTSMIELGLASRDGDRVHLSPEATKAARKGHAAIGRVIRGRVLAPELNSAPWGSQEGARDLTNALAWFLSFGPAAAPARMEGETPNARDLQEADFGRRQGSGDDGGSWPISNGTRWTAFQRWACSLGFAWRSPSGRLIPDPTPALRDSLNDVFGSSSHLEARAFVERVAAHLPVLETGSCRLLVEENWNRAEDQSGDLSVPTSDALRRLEASGALVFEDRDDSPRVLRDDGTTFSHVARGRQVR
ncbi:hypothetical protein BDK89_0149 [Ilumatobacter fluminis]|uniref:Uncharacterized protein n=1 Tax=Ilumatobacter fluminis TaxID=467091 RepID=A0A4R7HVR9_9ACTN|nr:hypothetical protein BDK89_0149 [Ilumatobacter fluminis]